MPAAQPAATLSSSRFGFGAGGGQALDGRAHCTIGTPSHDFALSCHPVCLAMGSAVVQGALVVVSV